MRRLSLTTERLADLTTSELEQVAGAQGLTGYYPTFDYPCLPDGFPLTH